MSELHDKHGVTLTAFWQDILYIYVTRVAVVRSDEIEELLKDALAEDMLASWRS